MVFDCFCVTREYFWGKFIAAGVFIVILFGAGAYSQEEIEPTNDLPNPYQTTAPWGRLPEGRKWGALSAVAIDNDGESVWVADRCGRNPDPGCVRLSVR